MSDKEIIDWIDANGRQRLVDLWVKAEQIASLGEYGPLTFRNVFSLAKQYGWILK